MSLKVAVITSTRAEYGLLSPLIKELIQDNYFETDILVTGTHLLEKYGNTVKYIKDDKIPIKYKIDIMGEDSDDVNIVIAKAITEFSKIFKKEKYDAIVVLGDRYEIYGFCIPAIMYRIPIIHIHGGEKSEGAIDEKIRHSVTKMSSIHFASIDEYAKRIIQMGEMPKYVYAVGALGIDNIKNLQLIAREDLERDLGVDFNKNVAIVTFHPVTSDSIENAKEQILEVLEALKESFITCIITMPNSDMGGMVINDIIQEYIREYPDIFIFRKSLGQMRYLSVLNYASMVVGNSSSGIIEAASFNIPTINIGDRQKGRFAPDTVLHCECEKDEIKNAINKGLSNEFMKAIEDYVNPYGDGKAALRMVKILKGIDFKADDIVQKAFYDIDF